MHDMAVHNEFCPVILLSPFGSMMAGGNGRHEAKKFNPPALYVVCIACQTNLVTASNCRSPWVWVLGNFFVVCYKIDSIA